MKNTFTRCMEGLLVGLLFVLLVAFGSTTATGQVPIIITGHVYVPQGTISRTSAWLTASNGERMVIELLKSGKFEVGVPANDTYSLHFSTPGCVTKEVVVDTRSPALEGATKARKVEFDIFLHNDGAEGGYRYTAAVGHIGFQLDGQVVVMHRYELVHASQLLAAGPDEQ